MEPSQRLQIRTLELGSRMGKAIGLVEYKTVSSGMTAADIMVKTADIDILQSGTVCPGKYFTLVTGEVAAVNAAVNAAKKAIPDKLIDDFVLGNPDESIYEAIWGTTQVEKPNAIGVLETYTIAQAIVCADVAVKTAEVTLIELRLARGMCGKSYLLITGEVAAVSMAIEKAKKSAGEYGMYLDSSVISGPDMKTWQKIIM